MLAHTMLSVQARTWCVLCTLYLHSTYLKPIWTNKKYLYHTQRNNCYLKFENTFKIPGWLYPEMIDDYENDFDMEISIGSSLPDIELDEDVNYLREKQRKRWESSQMENFKRKLFFSNFQKFLLHTLYCTLWHSTLALFRKKRFLVNLIL